MTGTLRCDELFRNTVAGDELAGGGKLAGQAVGCNLLGGQSGHGVLITRGGCYR